MSPARQCDVDEAYAVQSHAATHGALRATAVGVGAVIIAHHLWPAFRRQTLAFKGFSCLGLSAFFLSCAAVTPALIFSTVTVSGLVFGAESALMEHENRVRRQENAIRREARLDLARRGLIGTETEIAKWKEQRLRKLSEADTSDSS